eukprot:361313-Chlamydomonas_euryale.AAC.10
MQRRMAKFSLKLPLERGRSTTANTANTMWGVQHNKEQPFTAHTHTNMHNGLAVFCRVPVRQLPLPLMLRA